MTQPKHAALPAQCPNCQAQVHGPYCAQCGQAVEIETPSLWEFAHEYLHHYVALEGKLWRTLKLLLIAPGQLSAEYIAGRRARYVKPLPLYITFSFLFFLALSLGDRGWSQEGVRTDDPPAAASASAASAASAAESQEDQASDSEAGDAVERGVARMLSLSAAEKAAASQRFLSRLPYAMFLLMPLFALWLKLAQRRTGRLYGEHVVFTLHFHAFAFAALALTLLPLSLGQPVVLAVWVYLLLALRRFYRKRWLAALWQASWLLVLHLTCLGLALLGLLLLSYGSA